MEPSPPKLSTSNHSNHPSPKCIKVVNKSVPINEEWVSELVLQSRVAQSRAYAPYSQFNVGAAIRLKNGKIILGCNVENSAYPNSLCAERVALFSAIAQGFKIKDQIQGIAVITDVDKGFGTPCGSCRQSLSEFGTFPVYIANHNLEFMACNLSDLLPFPFGSDQLEMGKQVPSLPNSDHLPKSTGPSIPENTP